MLLAFSLLGTSALDTVNLGTAGDFAFLTKTGVNSKRWTSWKGLRSDLHEPDAKTGDASELHETTISNKQARAKVARFAGDIEARLVALMRGGSARVQYQAAGALHELSGKSPDNRAAITRAGAIEPLVALMRSGADFGRLDCRNRRYRHPHWRRKGGKQLLAGRWVDNLEDNRSDEGHHLVQDTHRLSDGLLPRWRRLGTYCGHARCRHDCQVQ